MGKSIRREILEIGRRARKACGDMSILPTAAKNKALKDMARSLTKQAGYIIGQNNQDIREAKNKKLAASFLDRLALNQHRIKDMARCLEELIYLKDPIGKIIKTWTSSINGLLIKKVSVPIGVVAIIYESRPNVTSDCIGLCVKTGNCVILRGGSEAYNSNQAIYKIISQSVRKILPQDSINMVPVKERQAVDFLVKMDDCIDLVIPRGGESLIRKVVSISRIPVIRHYKGICHIYVDKQANLGMAENLCFNAKVQRPGVCNAMETMLVHQDVANIFLPAMARRFEQAGVQMRGCAKTARIVKGLIRATDQDFRTEYLSLILSVKVVRDLDAAIGHINEYGTHHSDTIVTKSRANAKRFLERVDSACVYHNASTRFTDGYQFGMGAEIGISTDKIHARGPMALEELASYKYIVYGKGQIRK